MPWYSRLRRESSALVMSRESVSVTSLCGSVEETTVRAWHRMTVGGARCLCVRVAARHRGCGQQTIRFTAVPGEANTLYHRYDSVGRSCGNIIQNIASLASMCTMPLPHFWRLSLFVVCATTLRRCNADSVSVPLK